MKAWNWMLAAAGGVMVGLFATSAGSAPQEVVTKDGKTYYGEVEEKGNKLVVTQLNGEAAVTLLKLDVKERKAFKADVARNDMRKKASALKKEDVDGRLDLANWAVNRGLLPEALALYQDLAKEGNRRAEVEAARVKDLMASASTVKTGPKDTPKGEEMPAGETKLGATAVALDEKEVKKVKLREYIDGDTVRFVLTKKELAKDAKYKDFAAVNQDPKDLLAKAREGLAADAGFLEPLNFTPEPSVLNKWHNRGAGGRSIQDILVRNCATKACHGGAAEIKFQLLTDGITKEGVAYGNFDYVRRYNNGTLLRPNFPETSPILMYGLSAAEKKEKVGLDPSVKNHPVVKKMASTERDYADLKDWISKLSTFTPAAETPKAAAAN